LDNFIANFGLVLIGLVECIVIGWLYRTSKIREHANKTSEIMIGRWWDFLIKYVIPSVLLVLLVISIYDNIVNPYGNFATWVIIFGGFLPCVIIFLAAFILMKYKNKKRVT
jgi:NSS family neurotransmitter:Na+ symporter